jgi:hypothetical protein
MGKAARARAAILESGGWIEGRHAPFQGGPYAVSCVILCDCGKGGRIVTTAHRYKGEWAMSIEHDVEVRHFIELPTPPGFEGMKTSLVGH